MPADDTRGLMSDKYDGMASKAAAHSTDPKTTFLISYCVSTNRRLLCTVVEPARDCWIRRKGQYVDGEKLTAADVDHLEAMVDFINQEEPDVTVDESLEDFIFQEVAADEACVRDIQQDSLDEYEDKDEDKEVDGINPFVSID